MPTNPTFNEKELTLLLITLLKVRNILFDATEIKFDPRAAMKPNKENNISWKGKRGTCPILDDLEKTLALVRLHINPEETLQFYEAIGFFDTP